jgi:FAD/FMN-containing dehydrogenase
VRIKVLRSDLEPPSPNEARAVWNGIIDRHPRLIARCSVTADVAAAVRFARDRDLEIAVRGGRHNVAGTAVCDYGIVIDLSAMRAVIVDPVERTARVQGGALWGDVDHETQRHGLATTGGMVSHTGVGGLSLGDGIGWLMRKHGLTVDNLVEAEVVTAEGDIIWASANDHPDLFWALRGGGGNFGIATALEYRLHPVGPIVTGGMALYPAAQARALLQFFREFMAAAPDELMALLAFISAPPAPFVPQHLHGAPVVAFAICHVGSPEEGQRTIEQIRGFGAPAVDLLGPMPYVAVQQLFDASMPFGRQVYLRSDHVTGLGDAVIDALLAQAAKVTSPLSTAIVWPLGGAVARVGEHATAFGHRDTPFDVIVFSIWTDPQEAERHLQWGRDFGAAMRPFSRGVYVNEMGVEGEERVRAAYNPQSYARLVALKTKYDPTNLFRMNQNIPPADG